MSENVIDKKYVPRITGRLRSHALQLPDGIWKAKGIEVFGKRIRSLVFSTDIAIIRNCNADAVLAVYPFTPQQIISQTLTSGSSIPVFCGVGGGTTTGARSVLMARDAEAHGAFGVVVNAPMKNDTIRMISKVIEIPIVVAVLNEKADVQARIDAGASIINVTAGAKTAEVVRQIRKKYPRVPIIATGGATNESILETIEAGANAISFKPPTSEEIFADIMRKYRDDPTMLDASRDEEGLPATDEEILKLLNKID